jgi:hypothetical protein
LGTSEFTQLANAAQSKSVSEERKIANNGDVSMASATLDQIPEDPTNQFAQHQIKYNKGYVQDAANLPEPVAEMNRHFEEDNDEQ